MAEETNIAPVAPEAGRSGRTFDAKDIEENRYVAALSYLGVLFLVPLFMKKESPFAQFHARQGLVFTIAWIVGSFIFWFPLIGWALMLLLFVANIMALVRTISGQAWEVPCVKVVVEKLNI